MRPTFVDSATDRRDQHSTAGSDITISVNCCCFCRIASNEMSCDRLDARRSIRAGVLLREKTFGNHDIKIDVQADRAKHDGKREQLCSNTQ